MATDTLTVQGSKGNSYTLSVNGTTGRAECTCPSFRFSGRICCKHIEQALAELLASARHLTLV